MFPLKIPVKPKALNSIERKILMRKRTKLRKMSSTKSNTQLINIEKAICHSHFKEKLNEESIAVAKIKGDPIFFFRYAKKNSICKSDIGPIKKHHTQLLVYERLEICSLLLDQFNSVFTSPITNIIVHDPVSFFSCQPLSHDECLTDIEITEQIIIDSIHELSSTSAAGPDGVPSSILLKCAAELAPSLKLMFSQSLTNGLSLHHLKEQPLPRSSNQVPNLPQVIIGQYHSLLPLLKSLSGLFKNK